MTEQAAIFRILIRQHREMDAMLAQLADAESAQHRGTVLPVLELQLLAHAKAEEATLYRELTRAGEKKETRHAKREHRDIEDALAALTALDYDDERWEAALEHLTKTVDHHVEEEEGDVFETAQEMLAPEVIEALAEAFSENRRQQLEALGGIDDGYTESTKDGLLEQA